MRTLDQIACLIDEYSESNDVMANIRAYFMKYDIDWDFSRYDKAVVM